MNTICNPNDLIVFSHLRWDFVFQRPQHLMVRFAKHRRVFYVEEPVLSEIKYPTFHIRLTKDNVNIVVPHLPKKTKTESINASMKTIIDELIFSQNIIKYNSWYYTPMALPFTRHLSPESILFDCMDELSLFKGAPQALIDLESELLEISHLVFTGGASLYQAKKHRHHNIHPFPSSIEYDHFSMAREIFDDPEDQMYIPHPRIGFYGVIDERLDIDLLKNMSGLKPDYQFIILGPVIKIDEDDLPKASNIHYLGKKEYIDLPFYLSGWDCAMMPFALNDSTRFISPTKTPEFLAAGRPVVSTSITDVINPYKYEALIHIADTAEEFIECIDKAMNEKNNEWLSRVENFLKGNSWDKTFERIAALEIELKKTIAREDIDKNKKFFPFPAHIDGEFVTSGA